MKKVVVMTGGVGGAKLVLGLIHALSPEYEVIAIVNTGDDFLHLGLNVSPDIDTLLYTLSGKNNRKQGWGREGETWSFMAAARELGGPDWFLLGDGDLALHILRTDAIRRGLTLTEVTKQFTKQWRIPATILPMSDQPVQTMVHTDEGALTFQHYFVERRCSPVVRSITFEGAASASPAPGVVEAILSDETCAILVAPSNPFLSIDPILSVPGVREALTKAAAPVVAISPIISGRAVKGPTAKIMIELGLKLENLSVANHYAPMIDGMVVDEADDEQLPIATSGTNTLMETLDDRIRVAQVSLELAKALRT